MVETITPVVHGGSRGRWAASVLIHAAGATASAAAFGALLGAVGSRLGAPWGPIGVAAIAAAAAPYVALELGAPVPVPQLRRQVPEWWRTFFPPHVAALLYGLGLGPGLLTYQAHGTLVVVSVAAVASGSPLAGAGLLAAFGLARGLAPVLAFGVRTPGGAAALVDRLGRSGSGVAWRLANGLALVAVLAVSLSSLATSTRASDVPRFAGAVLAVAFGAAGVAKLARASVWRRALATFGLPERARGAAANAIPGLELAIAAMVLVGLEATAGLVALTTLIGFSAAIVVARVRTGPRLGCGCFGSDTGRDYRTLLARNATLGVAALAAWRGGGDAFTLGSLGVPGGSELLPAALVLAGLALAVWVGAAGVAAVRRGGR